MCGQDKAGCKIRITVIFERFDRLEDKIYGKPPVPENKIRPSFHEITVVFKLHAISTMALP